MTIKYISRSPIVQLVQSSLDIVAQMKLNFSEMTDKLTKFHAVLKASKKILVLTGAGVSAESGIPVFRGSGGFWKNYRAQEVATPEAFQEDPSLVWEFYQHRRGIAFKAAPNAAHTALAHYEALCDTAGREFNIITQNVDGLHQRAGSKNVIELHGSLRQVICTNSKCQFLDTNTDMPICEALAHRSALESLEDVEPVSLDLLPKCKRCNSLIRPHIVWFGENLNPHVLDKSKHLVETCDLCLVVGTSSVVYPAAMFAPLAAERGIPVAEFNINTDPASDMFQFHFSGPCGQTIPKAFNMV